MDLNRGVRYLTYDPAAATASSLVTVSGTDTTVTWDKLGTSTIGNNSFTATGAADGKPYRYAVVAISAAHNVNGQSASGGFSLIAVQHPASTDFDADPVDLRIARQARNVTNSNDASRPTPVRLIWNEPDPVAGCELDGYRILRADTTIGFDNDSDDRLTGGTPSAVLVADTGNTDRSYYDHDVHYKFYVTYDGTRQYFGYDAMPSMGTFQRSGDMTYWYVVQARCGDKIAKRTPWDIGRVEIDQPDVLPAPVWLDVDTAGASDTSEAPGPVRSLRVVAAAGSLTVTWQAPADIGTDDYATSQYRVDWADNDGFSGASAGSHTLSPVTGDRNERFSYTIPDLDNDTTYYVRVTTIGASAASDPVSSSATPSNSPSQPRSLSASINTASEEITVTWQAPERNGGTAIASYQLQYTTAANFNTPSEKTVTGTVSATLTTAAGDFSPGADLRIRVLATNTGGGQGPPSDIMRVSTLVDPGPVRSLMLDAADASLVVKWQPPADPGGADYRTTSYRVEWADNAVFTNPNQAVVSATTNSATEMLRHTISEYGSPAVALVNGGHLLRPRDHGQLHQSRQRSGQRQRRTQRTAQRAAEPRGEHQHRH